MRHAGRARVPPSSRPEAVEGVAVVCCCSSVDLVAVGSRVGGCCGCLNGGEVVGGGGAAALLLMCWRGGRHGSIAKEEQGKERKGKERRKEQRGKGIKKRLGRVLVCVRALHPTHIYIIGKTKYFNVKTKNYLFLFGSMKISLYICTRKHERINNIVKILRHIVNPLPSRLRLSLHHMRGRWFVS